MRGTAFALLITLALMSLSGRSGLPDVAAGPPEAPPPARIAPEDPLPGFGSDQIAAILHVLNPRLTESERKRIATAVVQSSARHGIDPALVTAVMWEESDVRPWVRSPKGAIGLMQVMPHMSARQPIAGNLTTIEKNVELGCLILADNIRRLGVEDGISAYFWGSEIRGVSYLHRVLEKQASVRRLSES